MKPQFIAHEMEFKGACDQADDPNRVVEVIRFSTQKEPRVTEAIEPDDFDPRQYTKSAFDWYAALERMGFKRSAYEDRGYYWLVLGKHQIMVWMTKHGSSDVGIQTYEAVAGAWLLQDSEHVPPTMVEQTVQSLVNRYKIKEALDPDAVDPKHYLKKAVRWPCAKCGRDLGAPESVIREYFSRHGHDPVHSLGHYDAEGSFEPDTSATLTAELHGYDLADDSDSCSACGESTMEKIQEAADPDDVDPRRFVKNLSNYYHVKGTQVDGKPVYLNSVGATTAVPERLSFKNALNVMDWVETNPVGQHLRGFQFQVIPADDQTQMFWQGRRYPQDFVGEAVDPDMVDPKQALKNVDVHYVIRKIGNPKLPPWWWNSQWGWGAHRARQRFDSRVEADDMIRERGLQGVGEVVPIIEETRTPDPFGGLSFPTDASQVARFLRKKRHRRPAVL